MSDKINDKSEYISKWNHLKQQNINKTILNSESNSKKYSFCDNKRNYIENNDRFDEQIMSAFNDIKSETKQFLQSNSDCDNKQLAVICGDVTSDHQVVNHSKSVNISELNVCQRVGFD